ncbi:hypothetical protein MUP65_02195 [Patescibacteria group bacterium]|nr:hypothetical protein [Patescibacteria group bacterium]
MGLDKNSLQADELANFYRAAQYLGLGDNKLSHSFLKKTFFKPGQKLLMVEKRLILAELVLDEYKSIKDACEKVNSFSDLLSHSIMRKLI